MTQAIITFITRFMSIRLIAIASGITATFALSTSLAVYSDTDTSASHFETGTLSLGLNPTTALFNVTTLKPGDTVYAPLTLTNTGSLNLTFTMASSATNVDGKGLAAALVAEVKKTSSATCNSTTFAAGTSFAAASTGLSGLAVSTPQALAASAVTYTCFQVTLPSSAANSLQGSQTDASFTFTSAQA